MRLAMIQMSNSGSVEKNMEKSLHEIAEAAERGAELVLFPEVQLTEFFPQYLGRDVSSYSVSIEDEIVKNSVMPAKSIRLWQCQTYICGKQMVHTMRVF